MWKPIEGYEKRYEVSDLGEVRNIQSSKILKPAYVGNATAKYATVTLSMHGKQTRRRVHHLVLEAFVGPRPAGYFACHNDGIRTHNRLSNLRWDTPSANTKDTVRHGKHNNAIKTHCPKGHEYTPENTLINGGSRVCRTCKLEGMREYHQKNRERLNAERKVRHERAKEDEVD